MLKQELWPPFLINATHLKTTPKPNIYKKRKKKNDLTPAPDTIGFSIAALIARPAEALS